jgi:hypothetical protein
MLLSSPAVADDPHKQSWAMADFRDAVYYPTVALLEGNNPYDVAAYRERYPAGHLFPLYSPFVLLLHLPFGALPLEIATSVYYLWMLAMVLALAVVTLRVCNLSPTTSRVFGLAALILLSRPGHWNLVNGNVSFQAALMSIAALHLARTHPNLAGLALGLATAKPTFGVPLGLLMLARRDYRAVAVGICVATAGTVAGSAILAHAAGGWTALADTIVRDYLTAPSLPGIPNVLRDWTRIDAPAVIAQLSGQVPPTWFSAMIGAACLAAAGLYLRRLPKAGEGADGLSGAVVVLATLSSVYHLAYDAVLLFVPLVALIVRKRQPWSVLSLPHRTSLIALVSFPLLNYVATSEALSVFQMRGMVRAIVCASSGLAILAALAVCLTIGHRTGSAKRPTASDSS